MIIILFSVFRIRNIKNLYLNRLSSQTCVSFVERLYHNMWTNPIIAKQKVLHKLNSKVMQHIIYL